MSDWTLILGSKNYSSWSLRAYLIARHAQLDFEEIVIPLGPLTRPDSQARLREHSPSGKVPVLRGPDGAIWDSLAIAEFLAERTRPGLLWPVEAGARARARAVAAEMHAGFLALRQHLPMDIHGQHPTPDRDDVRRDIARVLELWRSCRADSAAVGPMLFGAFSIADAMYAPVVTRFRSYGVSLDATCQAYADAVWDLPMMQDWVRDAARELGAR